METLEEWTSALDEGYGIDAIYLDYRKAFDTVPHKRLIMKLQNYGIDGRLLNWLKDFLTLRKMRVGINGSFLSWADVLSGVPQGSILGPILFLIYVNDIADLMSNSIRLFADDTKIWKQEAQLMLTTGSTRLAVSRGQQTWYHFGSIATFR